MYVGFDTETRKKNGASREAQLQPWRVKQGLVEVSYAAMVTEDDHRWMYPKQCKCITDWAKQGFFQDHTYVAWNATFDVAFLLASGCDLKGIRFEDTMLLWKHLTGGPEHQYTKGHYGLANGVETFLSDWEFKDEFLALKQREIANNFETDETEEYNYLDAQVAVRIHQILRPKLTKRQELAYLTEQATILEVAKSWLIGSPLDKTAAKELRHETESQMAKLEEQLGFDGKMLRSRKMTDIVYGEDRWNCPVRQRSDITGEPALNKAAMAFGVKDHPKMPIFAAWKKLESIRSKYTSSIVDIMKYTTDDRMYPGPRIFGTYTGRFTYAGKSKVEFTHYFKKGGSAVRKKEFQTALAVHQIPRAKNVKKIICAPPGKKIVEFDASGQESRIMAIMSRDNGLISMFNKGMDTHAFLGSKIVDMEYDAFMKEFKLKNDKFSGPQGYRMLGKIGNLSCQYRIGKAKLQISALTDYQVPLGIEESANLIQMFKDAYPGVVDYWSRAVIDARQKGYAETLDGRRIYISNWAERNGWPASQTAINTPIQGTGAGQKCLAIWRISVDFPEFEFFLDLHDGLYYYVDDNDEAVERCQECKKMLNNIDYSYYWGINMPIPMPWDCTIGYNRGEMVEI